MGRIVLSPLAQGLLTDRDLKDVPEDSRASARPGRRCRRSRLDETHGPGPRRSTRSRGERGQSLAQLALQWALRDPRVTVGGDRRLVRSSSSTPTSTRWTVPDLTDDELTRIDQHAVEAGINLWAKQTEDD